MPPAIDGQTKSRSRRSGYTLPEILITMGIVAVLATGVSSFFLHSLNTSYLTVGKLNVSADIRKFTTELTVEARNASYFELYENYANTDEILRDNSSGDMIVLYFVDETGEIDRIIGYFRAAKPGEKAPVRKFDSLVDDFDLDTLPSLENSEDFPIVIELSRGLADGRLFYNFYDRSILIRGEIVHRGNLTREATNTYNFTVSPRS